MSSLRFKYLIKVEPGENNNKYYKMTENADSTFTVIYGRVGAAKPQTKTYPIREWDSTYREKISARKGYVDQTDLFSEIKTVVTQQAGPDYICDDTTVSNLIIALRGYAKDNTAKTYLVKAESVTQAQIDRAQQHIDKLVDISQQKIVNVDEFNKVLLDLFRTIPRTMKEIGEHLVYGENGTFNIKTKKFEGNGKMKTLAQIKQEIDAIINDEQSNLDTMASQVIKPQAVAQSNSNSTQKVSLLQAMGLNLKVCTDKPTLENVKRLAQEHSRRVRAVFEISNATTQKAFDSHVTKAQNKKTELFWHGSRNQNWWWIIQQGLKIRPSNAVYTGSMFGDGIYFASECDKSMGYTDSGRWVRGNGTDRVYMALYNVHVGRQYETLRSDSYLSANKLKTLGGYDSTWGKKGPSLMRHEYIIYNSDQSTIKYLVEFSN